VSFSLQIRLPRRATMAKLQQRTWFNQLPRSAHPNAASLGPIHGKKRVPVPAIAREPHALAE
jgi:hypothetical protein